MQKSVILVENNKECCKKIKIALETTFKSKVVAALSTQEDVNISYTSNHPDIILISMDPDNQKEITYAKKFINNNPDALTVALSSSEDHFYHKFVKKIGFFGFINKKNFLQDYNSTLNILNS